MMKSINSLLTALRRSIATIDGSRQKLDELKMNQGILLAGVNEQKHSTNLQHYEFGVFSQWGEDGIIQHLVNVIEINEKTFIEFGVEDFSESNCRFLLMKDNWSGFVIDGSATNIDRLKQSTAYWKYDLDAVDAFITKENINDLLAKSGFGRDLGILSIDLDGNDYYILEAIDLFSPRILICEYNAVFGVSRIISVPYDAGFVRKEKHNSCLYYGASLSAIAHAAKKKGYSLVGTNTAGNNAFFVRNDLLNNRVAVLTCEDGFTPSKFRESRNQEGELTLISGGARLDMIRGLPVFNVETNALEEL
jgi:hypothetical protein